MVLCGANAYEQKYYLNPDFENLPGQIKEELQILCVLYTEEIGGIFTIEYDENGSLLLKTESRSDDFMYDEIGGELKIRQLQTQKQELFRSLELYYQIFCQGGVLPEEPEDA